MKDDPVGKLMGDLSVTAHWYYISDDGVETGPVTKQQLEHLAASGRLKRQQQIRNDEIDLLFEASRLKGLFPVESAVLATGGTLNAPSQTAARSPAVQSWWRHAFTRRWASIPIGALIVLIAASAAYRMSTSDPTFPKPKEVVGDAGGGAARKSVLEAPEPRVPSIPNLERSVPTLIPGLEKFVPAYSPCLTSDLNCIVFASAQIAGNDYDLYESTRTEAGLAFSPPLLIQSCATSELEAYPAISPDGLELVFCRGLEKPRFFICSRESRQVPFGSPQLLEIPELNPKSLRLGRPQFITDNQLAFRRGSPVPTDNEIVFVERSDRKSRFGSPSMIPFANSFPLYFLSSDQLRAYAAVGSTVVLTARRRGTVPFGRQITLVDGKTIGPVDGPIWVSPKEDVIFFCSPGLGQDSALGVTRQLWMLRY